MLPTSTARKRSCRGRLVVLVRVPRPARPRRTPAVGLACPAVGLACPAVGPACPAVGLASPAAARVARAWTGGPMRQQPERTLRPAGCGGRTPGRRRRGGSGR
jgi:hypothetical protein